MHRSTHAPDPFSGRIFAPKQRSWGCYSPTDPTLTRSTSKRVMTTRINERAIRVIRTMKMLVTGRTVEVMAILEPEFYHHDEPNHTYDGEEIDGNGDGSNVLPNIVSILYCGFRHLTMN